MSEEDDQMTPEERMEWLRERGVQIVSPGDRQGTDVDEEPVYYVRIPADRSQPIEELSFRPTCKGDALAAHLQPAFSQSSESVDLSLLDTKKHLVGTDAPTPSEETLQRVAQEGLVETFAFIQPSQDQPARVQFYLDEVGMLKRLPLNPRATEYAKLAGFNDPPPVFFGDIYVGRLVLKPHFRPAHFRKTELLQAEPQFWEDAQQRNFQHQAETRKHMAPPPVQETPGHDGTAQTRDGYTWTQTEEEVEIVVEGITDKKALKVEFRPKQVHIQYPPNNVDLRIYLFLKVDTDGCTWTYDRTESKLTLTLEKVEPALWPRIED